MQSPCILVCSIDWKTGYCFGCGRTREEIASWTSYDERQRLGIMDSLPERMTQVERPPKRETKRRKMARLRDERADGEQS